MTTLIRTVSPFKPDNGFRRAWASGHQRRLGHTLTGYYVPTKDGLSTLVKTCCGES
jgi:hypothetical protein